MNDHTLISSEFSLTYGLRILLYTFFFSLPFTSVSIAQTCGCDVVCLNGLSETMVCGPYNDPAPGPYYVKLYLRFVDAGPGSFEESFAERAETIWANLQKAFSDQNIYFVPGFSGCTGAQSFQVISSTIFPDLGNLTEFNALMSGSTNGATSFFQREFFHRK